MKYATLVLASISVTLCAASCRAAVVYVNKNAPGPTHDGTSWATAYATVQSGLSKAVAGDEIWVASGTYVENIGIGNGKSVFGGFAGSEALRSQRDWAHNLTILDGGRKNYVVAIVAGSGSQSVVIDGFTIRNGVVHSNGGGIRGFGEITIANSKIVGNIAVNNGQGWGGGIAAQSGSVITITNCLIAGNVSDQGGGIYASASQASVTNCTITDNHATSGGGIWAGSSNFTGANDIVAYNDSGIYIDSTRPVVHHCDVFGNFAYNYDAPVDPTGTSGNISLDPKLSAYSLGCHLQPGSPCIDSGDDSVVTQGQMDLYGKPRIIGAHVDIGADESEGTLYPIPPARIWRVAPTGDEANDGSTWAKAKASVGMTLLLAQAGDEVWVAAGTYPCAASLRSGVGLYGGFAGTETGRTQRNPQTNLTILDGTVYKTSTATYAWRVLTIAPDATSDTVVDGFTIQNGDGVNGSGIYISGGTPTISNNIFSCNGRSALVFQSTTFINGGGIYVSGGAPTITGNAFAGNFSTGNGATNGAGIYVANGTAIITNNSFSGCSARVGVGGGVCAAGGTPLIANNTVTLNYAGDAGGIYATGGLVRDNLIASNQAGAAEFNTSGSGGGVYLGPGAVAIHNIILGNTIMHSRPGGGGAGVEGLLIDNILQDNGGSYGAAVAGFGDAVISRNKITSSVTDYSECQAIAYGGTFTENLIVSQQGEAFNLWSSSSQPNIVSNTLINVGPKNSGTSQVVGVRSFLGSGYPALVSNNIISGYGLAGATGLEPSILASFTTDHNDLYGNTDNTMVLAGASPIGVNGNISQDPLFVNAATGDYRLQAGSPCIDAGNDAYVALGDRDLAGAPRIYGAHVDIGAYEYGSPLYTVLDAAEVLRIAAGISIATPADVSRLDVVPEPTGQTRLTVTDATLIAKWLLE